MRAGEDLVEEERRRRLAARPGHARHHEPAARVAGEARGEEPRGAARVLDLEVRHLDPSGAGAGPSAAGAPARTASATKARPSSFFPGKRGEEDAGARAARVVRDAPHLRVARRPRLPVREPLERARRASRLPRLRRGGERERRERGVVHRRLEREGEADGAPARERRPRRRAPGPTTKPCPASFTVKPRCASSWTASRAGRPGEVGDEALARGEAVEVLRLRPAPGWPPGRARRGARPSRGRGPAREVGRQDRRRHAVLRGRPGLAEDAHHLGPDRREDRRRDVAAVGPPRAARRRGRR